MQVRERERVRSQRFVGEKIIAPQQLRDMYTHRNQIDYPKVMARRQREIQEKHQLNIQE